MKYQNTSEAVVFLSFMDRCVRVNRRGRFNKLPCRQVPISTTAFRFVVVMCAAFFVDVTIRHPHAVSGCIMLLDGWTPMSAGERATLADIVAFGFVQRTFKDVDSMSKVQHEGDTSLIRTYTSEVRLVRVVKGRLLIEQLDDVQMNSSRDKEPSLFASNHVTADHSRRQTRVLQSNTTQIPQSSISAMAQRRVHSPSASTWPPRGRLFNVTNFGDSSACYVDVSDESLPLRHVFFMTIFKGHLSARYDDLFGAVTDWSRDIEEEIDEALGWTPWSDWSACGTICGGGIQKRWRLCTFQETNSCEGETEQQRKCNDFRCKGSKDLLAIAVSTMRSPGVRRPDDRPSAYVIDHSSSINAPASKIVPRGFPTNYSLLITARQKLGAAGNEGGYLLTLNNLFGFVHIGVKVGRLFRLEHNGPFAYLPPDGSTRQQFRLRSVDMDRDFAHVEFSVDLADGSWHQIAAEVQTGSHVTLHVDCHAVATQRWQYHSPSVGRSIAQDIDDGVVSIGKSFIENSRYPQYEGEVEQLTLVPDNEQAASQQCENIDHFREFETTISDSYVRTSTEPTSERDLTTTSISTQYEIAWSEWSTCSATCGTGVEARMLICRITNNDAKQFGISRGCPNDYIARTETRPCRRTLTECPGGSNLCRKSCYNGATCLPDGSCQCSPGYSGRRCKTALCELTCSNGGRCVAPNRCACRAGFTGKNCRTPVCNPPCLNGGTCSWSGTCRCIAGTYGLACEHFSCSPPCVNDGICVAENKCQCPDEYSGQFCQTKNCSRVCENGGTCLGHTCKCPVEFEGPTCSQRRCRKEIIKITYERPYNRLVTKRVPYKCGVSGLKSCTKTKYEYRTAFKTAHKTIRRCA